MDLVFHAVQTRHQQGGKAQVGVHERIGEAGFHTATLGVGHVRNADRGRTVLGRISQLHRCFEVGHQALVAVGARVGDGVQRTGVLDDAADVVQRKVRQTCIAVACEQVFAVFPDRLVHMHTRTVVTVVGLGHEGGGLAVGIGNVMDDVLLQHGPVGAFDQGAKTRADFVLACTRHFVVEHFNRNAQRFEDQRHFSAHVLRAVDRRHGEVTTLDRGTVPPVATFKLGAGVPRCFVLFDFVEGVVGLGAPAHAVENKELGLGAEECRVTQTRGLEVGFGPLGDRAGIAVIRLAIAGLDHVTGQDQRRFFEKRVDIGRIRVGNQLHIGGFDPLPSGN